MSSTLLPTLAISDTLTLTAISETSDLYGHESIASVGLQFHRGLGLLVCCEELHLLAGHGQHWTRRHVSRGQEPLSKAATITLRAIAGTTHAASVFPAFEHELAHAIEGLAPPTPKAMCPSCRLIAARRRDIQLHITNQHQSQILEPSDVLAQRITHGRRGPKFVVVERPVNPPPDYHGWPAMFFDSDLPPVVAQPATTRGVTALMRKTRWHTQVSVDDAAALVEFISFPKAREFKYLAAICHEFFSAAVDLIHDTPNVVLKYLNSADRSAPYVIVFL
jgi:hypothetical protein